MNQESLMQKEESCEKLHLVVDDLNKALIDADDKVRTAEKEKEQLRAQCRALEIQRNSVKVVCGCFAWRR